MVQPIEQQDDPLQPPPLGQSLQQGRTAAAPAPGFEPSKLLDGWNSWIDKPNNRAALMQFGIAMLQPMGMGETGAGHFANAVGAAGEAHQRVTGQAQQAEKASTEAQLRESTASAREQTAGAAEMRAASAGQLAETRAQLAGTTNLARNLQAQSAARARYDKYSSDHDLLSPNEQKLSFPDWLKSGGDAAAQAAGGLDSAAGAPGGTPSPRSMGRWEDVQRDPKIQSAISFVRQKVATGNPQEMERAKQYIQTVIAPQVDPADLPRVYATFGVTP